MKIDKCQWCFANLDRAIIVLLSNDDGSRTCVCDDCFRAADTYILKHLKEVSR